MQTEGSVMEMRVWGSGHWRLRTWGAYCLLGPPSQTALLSRTTQRSTPSSRSEVTDSNPLLWSELKAETLPLLSFSCKAALSFLKIHCFLFPSTTLKVILKVYYHERAWKTTGILRWLHPQGFNFLTLIYKLISIAYGNKLWVQRMFIFGSPQKCNPDATIRSS